MSVVPLFKMRKAREMITAGISVKETALKLKVSESWVRSYTKAERARA